MNFYIFKKEDKSGKMSKRSYLEKNYPNELSYMIDWSLKNKIQDIPLKEIIYLFLNNKIAVPTCKNTNCNKTTKFRNKTLGYRDYCSNKCISSDPNMIKHKEKKSLEKWGTKAPAQSKKVKDKIIKTNNERYGHNSPIMNADIKKKSIDTLKKNWGVSNPSKNKIILDKRVESFKNNVESYKESYKKTSLDRYGTEHPWSNVDVHNKSVINSNKSKNNNFLKSVLKKIKNIKNVEFVDVNYLNRTATLNCRICNNHFNIHREYLHLRYKNNTLLCTHCNPFNDGVSGMERNLKAYINEIYKSKIIENDRTVLNGKELDIFIPELKLAIEFNGLYWHSEINKSRLYHYDKTKECQNRNIRLIHVWEDDWILRNDIIKSILKNSMGLTPNRIYGRDCFIKEVSLSESRYFLNENHIQGNCNSGSKIGLYYKDELVSLMCFSIPRGYSKNDNTFELIRFCNKINTNVIGSANRLFKFFIKKFNPKKVITFSDNSIFNGQTYSKMGFEFHKNVPISYTWVINHIRNHKSRFSKSSLIKKGYDSSKSEQDIMYEEFNAFRIWDSGKKKWIYKNKIN